MEKPSFIRNSGTIMPKKLVWKTKTIRKRVKVPPKRFGSRTSKPRKQVSDRPGSLIGAAVLRCSPSRRNALQLLLQLFMIFCRFHVVLTKTGFGLSPITIQKEDLAIGDCDELLCILQVLVNSKAFIEFLCSCRCYSNPTRKGKKHYFLGVLSNFLRDVALNPSAIPEPKSANQFIKYCLKWIPSLRQRPLSASAFLQEYFGRIESELEEINSLHFKYWCSRALLSSDGCSDPPPCLKPSSAAPKSPPVLRSDERAEPHSNPPTLHD